MSRAKTEVCVFWGEGNAGVAMRVKVNRPNFWHGSGSVFVRKNETESNAGKKKEEEGLLKI